MSLSGNKKKKRRLVALVLFLQALILGSYLIKKWWYEEAVTWIFLILGLFGMVVFFIGTYHAIKNTYKDLSDRKR